MFRNRHELRNQIAESRTEERSYNKCRGGMTTYPYILCAYICVIVYVYKSMCLCKYLRMHVFTYVWVCVCGYVGMYVYMYACMGRCMYECNLRTYIPVYLSICLSICVLTCHPIYLSYIYIILYLSISLYIVCTI